MKKTARIIALVVAIGCAFSAVSLAAGDGTSQMGRALLKVKKATSAVKQDGKMTDKTWKKATTIPSSQFVWGICTNRACFVNGKSDVKQFTSAALNGRKVAKPSVCKLAWDAKYLYIYTQVSDSTNYCKFPYTDYKSDGIEYYIDGQDTNKSITDSNKSAAQYMMARNAKGFGGNGAYSRTNWGSKANKAGCKTYASYYVQEVKIKFSDHKTSGAVGKKMGFDLQINDANSVNGVVDRANNITWNSLDNAWTNAATMGTIQLVK